MQWGTHASSRDWQPCVYIVASRKHGTLYIGVTSSISRRAFVNIARD